MEINENCAHVHKCLSGCACSLHDTPRNAHMPTHQRSAPAAFGAGAAGGAFCREALFVGGAAGAGAAAAGRSCLSAFPVLGSFDSAAFLLLLTGTAQTQNTKKHIFCQQGQEWIGNEMLLLTGTAHARHVSGQAQM
eukprot:1145916-Pelagomonas_calceolata.AAC.1